MRSSVFPIIVLFSLCLIQAQERNLQNIQQPSFVDAISNWVDSDTLEYVNKNNLSKIIQFLSSEELEGRLTGSRGEELASQYLVKELEKLSLTPYLHEDFIHVFEYKVRLNPHNPNESKDNHGKNVIAYLDNDANKTIIIGAHYDHLGRNEHRQSTLPNSDGMIHYGADDNASGVASVMEIARILSQNSKTEEANFVFALFSGEEDGLIGSKQFSDALEIQKMIPSWAPKSWRSPVVTMINLDMIGRLNQEKVLNVGGIGTSPKFGEIAERLKPDGVNLAIDSSGIGPSDHTSFYVKNIPVLFFFTGTHEDYHKPSDVYEKINLNGVKLITKYVYEILEEIMKEESLPFLETKAQTERIVPQYEVSLGIMPSYADSDSGMKVDGVMDNRPGEKAGLKQGDVITKIGECEIKEIYSYMECLSELKPGDEVQLIYIRQGNEQTTKVFF